MKKITLALSLLAVLGAASCKKDDDKKSSGNTWTVDGTTYTSIGATVNDNAYAFTSASGTATAAFYFHKLPTASGTYHIVESADNDDEVSLLIGTASPAMVADASAGNLTVTVNSNGDVNMKCSGITIDKSDASGSSIGTGTFSSDLTY